MQITIQNLKSNKSLTQAEAITLAVKMYQIKNYTDAKLIKKSLDLRDKANPKYIYNLVFEVTKPYPKENKNIIFDTKYRDDIIVPQVKSNFRPIVVGFGPSGIFCALILAKAGLKPIIFERGKEVSKRKEDIDTFFNEGIFNAESNVAFGEGGAGTFSDGKLTTNLNDPRIKFIFKTFIEAGAKESIYYDGYPHVGTDRLQVCIPNIRKQIIDLGGEFHFESIVTEVDSGYVKVGSDIYYSDAIFLGIGHSAKETYEMLYQKGFALEPKAFSMGVRIEHPQSLINEIQYGKNSNIHDPATYKAVAHLGEHDVYTFCMCPGGYVVPSNSDANTVVTNGMSYEARGGINANSAVLVSVRVEDYFKNSPLDGLYYQEFFEKACYNLTQSYQAPCNLLKEFLVDEVATTFRSVKPTYARGTFFSSFEGLMPDYVIKGLKLGIADFNKRMKGFLFDDAILTAIESRSSSPVRILRGENYTSINKVGVYPMGEGAGYAGGITSSALDGIKCAFSYINSLKGE